MDKVFAFDYMLTQFEEWHKCVAKNGEDFGKLSKLSFLKLLFLTSAPKKPAGKDLLDTFNQFCALPYGPVESCIYDKIKQNELPSYFISERNIKSKEMDNLPYNPEEYVEVKNAVEELKEQNSKLILLSAFDLVEITHKWESWKTAFNFAQFMGIQSYEMSPESIRNDNSKYFGKI